jgi:hypothetical protein
MTTQPAADPVPPRRLPSDPALAFVLLAAHATLLLVSSWLQSPTRNEVAHVPAGLSYWEYGTFSLYGVNPPFGKLLATLPTLALHPNTAGVEFPEYPGHRPEWDVARRFAADNAANYFAIMWSARLAGIVWSVLGGWLIYRWGGDLCGPRAGPLALAVWTFGPNVLAHAPLVTPDIPCAVSALAATYVFRNYLRSGTWPSAVLAGVLLGVAQLTKFTLLILYPLWPALAILHALDRANTTFRAVPALIRLLQGLTIILLSVVVLNLGYGFVGSWTALGDYEFVSASFTGQAPDDGPVVASGNRFRETWLKGVPVPLPVDYLLGIDLQRKDFEGKLPSYLRGEWRDHGWWYYYLYALAVKVPLGTLALVGWAAALTTARLRSSATWTEELTVWLPALVVLGFVSSQTGYTHHLRYVLPAAPFACVGVGTLARFLVPGRRYFGGLVLLLLTASAISSLRVYPHSLSYFNELAGGPERGYEHLADSNIDWAQDMFFLKAWADRHPEARPLGFACYYIDYRHVIGTFYGQVPPDPPVDARFVNPREAEAYGPWPGWYAVDVTSMLSKGYTYFRRLKPVDRAGYSIYIYHITPDQANRVRRDMGLPPLEPPAQ